jgi:transcriptional regulator with XRE-family HTH domain
MARVPDSISASQLVAHNLTRIRKTRGWSQEQAAVRLEPYLGVRWSKAVYSAAERSYSSKRVRQFTAAELAAFALAFEVPVVYFFMPPKPDDRTADGVLIGDRFLAWPDVFDIMQGGEARSAIQLRLDELPIKERDPASHALVAAGLGTWIRIDPAGERSRYDASAEEFRPESAEGEQR